MTELIPGKRYRITFEGAAEAGGWLTFGSPPNEFALAPADVAAGALELLPDPLPTTPGSVIHLSGHGILMRRYPTAPSALTLPWVDSEGHAYSDNTVEGADVLFDAGVDRA